MKDRSISEYTYTLGVSTLKFNRELPQEVVDYLSGQATQDEPKLEFLKKHGLNSGLSRYLIGNIKDYYYVHGRGYVHFDDWKLLLDSEFVDCKKTITQWCYENNVPRSIDRWFKQKSLSYKAHIESSKYRSLLGNLTRTRSSYGKLVNAPKTDRVVNRVNDSYDRALVLSEKYDVQPLFTKSEWQGAAHMNDGKKIALKYKVKCKICGEVFEVDYANSTMKRCPVCVKSGFTSFREGEIYALLKSLDMKVFRNVKGVISVSGRPLELDLYLPDMKVAFEFNGYYFHSVNGVFPKDKYYHKVKTELCLEKGIKLYHLWEDTSTDLVKSIVLSKIWKLPNRVYARNCSLEKVSSQESAKFMTENHVDGSCRVVDSYALKFNNEIVACLTVRFNGVYIEIARFACKKMYSVIGGYSRLLSKVMSDYKQSILTYCNRDLSPSYEDNFYANHGFSFLKETSLIMKYYSVKRLELNGKLINSNTVVPRQLVQKRLIDDNSGRSERDIAYSIGLIQSYNSGNFVYLMERDERQKTRNR